MAQIFRGLFTKSQEPDRPIRRYYRPLFKKAWEGTVSHWGWNRKSLIALLLYIIGSVLLYFFSGPEPVKEQFYFLIPVGLYSAYVFISELIKAPIALQQEGEEKWKNEVAKARQESQTAAFEWARKQWEAANKGERHKLEEVIRERSQKINQLEDALKPRLEIYFEPAKHRHQLNSQVVLYRIGVRNSGLKTIPRVSVKLKQIEQKCSYGEFSTMLVAGPFKVSDQLKHLFDAPLMLKHDRADPPTREFSLDGKSDQDIDVIQAAVGQHFEICHAIGYSSLSLHNVLGKVRDPNPHIPPDLYRLTIVAEGQDTAPEQAVFYAKADKDGTLIFYPEELDAAPSLSDKTAASGRR